MNIENLTSFVQNCIIQPRESDAPLFFEAQSPHGAVLASRLDGYAIIPKEEYERLTAGKGADEVKP